MLIKRLVCVPLHWRVIFQLPPRDSCSVSGGDYAEHKLLLGTHTNGTEPNHLCIATVRLPTEDAVLDARKYDEEKGGACSRGKERAQQVGRRCSCVTEPKWGTVGRIGG